MCVEEMYMLVIDKGDVMGVIFVVLYNNRVEA